MWNLLSLSKSNSKDDKKLVTAIRTIVGVSPSNLALYKLATLHSSKSTEKNGFRESNERLEYLGDAILGAAVADYLFKKYPFQNEGFLTEIRSRIVNRESLNNLARKVGIGAIPQGFGIEAELVISLPGIDSVTAQALIEKAHQVCPYSNATRGNIEVKLTLAEA